MKFSIIVPSYNQAQYLEDCLDSIVAQRGVDKEIIVMDGGSTDGSVDIIRRFEPHLAYWQSQKDGGQSAAINAGFARATGDLFGWLCSDDLYAPAALRMVEEKFTTHDCEFLAGRCVSFREKEEEGPWLTSFEYPADLSIRYLNYIDQPSAFWTRDLWERAGPLREDMNFAFDWEWWVRAEKIAGFPLRTNQVYSFFRWHAAHKTSNSGVAGLREALDIWKTHMDPEAEAIARHLMRRRPLHRYLRRAERWLRLPGLSGRVLGMGGPHQNTHPPKGLEMMANHIFWVHKDQKENQLSI